MGKIGGKSTYHAAIVSIVGVLLDSSIVSIKISFQTREEATLWHLALEKAKSFISRQASSGDMQVLIDVSFRMKSAVPIRDRFYYMHVHTRCFLGSDAVRWIQSDQHCSEQEAVELGNRMLNVNLIYHVQHNRFFFNSKYLYRFNKHSLRDIVEGLLAPIGIIPDLTFSNSKRLASSVSPNHKAEEDEYKPIPAQTEDPSIQLELMTLKSTRGSINQLKRSHHKIITELSNLKELHEDQKQTLQTYKFIVVCLLCTFISHIILRDHYYCSFANMLTFYAASFVFFYFLKRFTRIGTADDTNRDEFPDEYSALLATSTVLDEDVPLPTVLDKNMLALPVPSSWPNRPILVRRSPSMFIAEESLLERLEPSERERIFRLTRPLHIHTPDPEMSVVEIDSNVFCGKLYTIFAGLKDSPIKFFRYHRLIPLYNLSRSKKRLFEVIIQGRFKKSVPFCEVYTGQIFSKPFAYLPPSWLTQMVSFQ